MSFFGIGRKRGEKGRRGEKRRGGRKREEEGGGGAMKRWRKGKEEGRGEEKRRGGKRRRRRKMSSIPVDISESRIRVTQYDTLTGSGVTELIDPRGDTDVEPRGEADVVEEVLRSVEDLDTTRCGCLVVLALR